MTETQYFTRPEGTLGYSDYGGHGVPVIMLPGMAALRSEYRFLAQSLSDAGYRAITVDLRGHGDSSVGWSRYDVPSVGEDILALIDHLHLGSAHVIATSFSPAAAVWATIERPEAIRSLVLIGAFVRDAKVNLIMKGIMWLMMNNPWRVQTWAMFYYALYPTEKPDDFAKYIAALTTNLRQKGRFDAVKQLMNSSREPSETRLSQVQVPTLVVMGTKDPDFPDPSAEAQFIADATNGQLLMIDGAGHYPQTEMPDVVNPHILNFLEAISMDVPENIAVQTTS